MIIYNYILIFAYTLFCLPIPVSCLLIILHSSLSVGERSRTITLHFSLILLSFDIILRPLVHEVNRLKVSCFKVLEYSGYSFSVARICAKDKNVGWKWEGEICVYRDGKEARGISAQWAGPHDLVLQVFNFELAKFKSGQKTKESVLSAKLWSHCFMRNSTSTFVST